MSEDWPAKYHNTPYTLMEKALVVHHLMKWKDRAEKAEARVKELEASHKKLLDGISEDCAKMRSILGSE